MGGAMTWDEIEKYIDSQRRAAVTAIGQHAIDPEDILQECRIKIWSAHKRGMINGAVKAYVQRAIKNAVVDAKRRPSMANERNYERWLDSKIDCEFWNYSGDATEFGTSDGLRRGHVYTPGSQKEMDNVESSMMLEWVLDRIPEQYHGSFLGKLEGLSDKEIADNTGTTLLSHKSRWSRSRKLAERLWDTLKTSS
jgi:DNA-directed RNA polymerase specialized sigma24 family protein